MHIDYLSFADTGQFSDLILDYVSQSEKLQHFYKYPPDLAAFDRILEEKQIQPVDRERLVKVLQEQYKAVPENAFVAANVKALQNEQTFTITTAHQPALFSGPLYFIIKIQTAINLAEKLNQLYPDYQFVPVYWLGGEDHDFDEINHLHVFGKTLTWHDDTGGPVGRLSTSHIKPVLDEMGEIMGDSDFAREWMELLHRCYGEEETLAAATRRFVHELFGDQGLVILSPDHPELKRAFSHVMEEELLKQTSHDLVQSRVEKLQELGYHEQAHAREINLFYLQDGLRERIVKGESEDYEVLNTDLTFSEKTLLSELKEHPDRFSPNVILRPLYQEFILPNLAYVGGGGELAYWLQYEGLFEHYRVNFPMLVLRNSIMWLDSGASKKQQQLGISISDLFRDEDDLIKEFVKEHAEDELSLAEEQKAVQEAMAKVIHKAKTIDPTLEKSAKGEEQKILNSLEKLEAKLLRAEKQKFDTSVNQIRWLKDKLFPDGVLQERHENIASFYLKYGPEFLKALKEAIQPLEKEFIVISDK